MSYQSSITGIFRSNGLDITIAKVGLIASLLLLSLRLLAEQELLVVIPVSGATACAVYLFTRRREGERVNLFSLRSDLVGYLPSVVILGLAAIVLSIYLQGGRTVLTQLLTGGVGGVLILQVLLFDDRHINPKLILLQILSVSVVIRFGILFGTPGFTGVDIWTHVTDLIAGIVDDSSLNAIADNKYVMAPIYHLTGAVATIVLGSPRAGVFLSIGTVLAVSIILIYATARLFVPARWALLATVLFAFSSEVLQWSVHLIPTSLGLVFFLGMLYGLTKLYYRPELRLLGLILCMGLAVVFTHQVSTAVVLLVLGIAAVVSVVTLLWNSYPDSRQRKWTTYGLVGTFSTTGIITLVSWANTPFSGEFIFLWRMLDVLERQIADEVGFLNLASTGEGGGGGAGGATGQGQAGLAGELIPYVEWLGLAILLAATIIGGIILLRYVDIPELKLTYLAVFGAMFVVVYGLSLFGLRTFMPGRWLAFMHAPMVIIGAIGLYYVAQHTSYRVFLAVVLVVAIGYPMTMMAAEKATLDAPVFEDEYPRFAHTESEIGAVETISEYRPPAVESEIGTDHPYRTVYERLGGYDIPDMIVEDGQPVSPDTTVAREYQLEGPATVHVAGDPVIPRQSSEYLTSSLCGPDAHHLYTSDTVTVCTAVGGE